MNVTLINSSFAYMRSIIDFYMFNSSLQYRSISTTSYFININHKVQSDKAKTQMTHNANYYKIKQDTTINIENKTLQPKQT